MSFVQWSDDYSVKVRIIDQQHKKLMALVNQMHDGLLAQRGDETLKSVLRGLVAYTEWHFLTEERLMVAHRYPGYKAHKSEHEALAEKVLNFQSKFDSTDRPRALDVMNFLKEWLIDHILGTDKLLRPYLSSKGVR